MNSVILSKVYENFGLFPKKKSVIEVDSLENFRRTCVNPTSLKENLLPLNENLLEESESSTIFSQFLLTLLSIQEYIILTMIISGIFYLLGVTVLIYFFPSITGLDRKQIKQGLSWIRKQF